MLKDELILLKKELLEESYNVNEMIRLALKGIQEKKIETLDLVIDEKELEVNEDEVMIEQHCIELLGLFQPAAKDLREVIMIIKINNDLERIADLAVKCAKSGKRIINESHPIKNIKLQEMGVKVTSMLKDVINSFIDHDPKLATDIVSRDDEVDRLRDENYKQIIADITKAPDSVRLSMHTLRISKSLERIADHITHIAEDVIYILKAESIRHT